MEQVLANWLREARNAESLVDGVDEAGFVAARFLEWWRPRATDSLGDAERFARHVESELKRLGGWENRDLHEAMEDTTHLREALADLRSTLGLADET